MRRLPLLASILLFACGGGSSTTDAGGVDARMAMDARLTDGGAISDAPAGADAPQEVDAGPGSGPFPVRASDDRRYLVDRNGAPFLLAADAPQALVVNISEADARDYFANRASHAFNALWVNLLCAEYTGGRTDGTTFDGVAPFTTPDDLSTPNEAYFAHVDQLLRDAAAQGLMFLLDPIETGAWLDTLRNNGTDAARAYGRYLGARYASFDNIVWMSGNDFQSWRTDTDDQLVVAVALGIRDMDSRHIHTVELDYNQSDSVDDPTWAAFIELNAAYSYESIYARLYRDYDRADHRPTFLVESNYEGEALAGAPHTTNAHDVRAQYYWTDLSGGAGQAYGNHSVWPFASDWRDHLDDPGAVQNRYLQELLTPRAWYALVPDEAHSVVTSGYGQFVDGSENNQDNDYAPTARTADGTLVITYLPTARAITVDMTQLAAPATASWHDPTDGTSSDAGSPVANSGSHVFTPPAAMHADGSDDWVLVIETSPP